MEVTDANRKRSSDEVLGTPTPTAITGLEIVPAAKNGGTVPPSPPPKQDPKRPKPTLQNEKNGNGSLKKTPTVGKNYDARLAASPAEDRRAQ